jgi:hypothetical protein
LGEDKKYKMKNKAAQMELDLVRPNIILDVRGDIGTEPPPFNLRPVELHGCQNHLVGVVEQAVLLQAKFDFLELRGYEALEGIHRLMPRRRRGLALGNKNVRRLLVANDNAQFAGGEGNSAVCTLGRFFGVFGPLRFL